MTPEEHGYYQVTEHPAYWKHYPKHNIRVVLVKARTNHTLWQATIHYSPTIPEDAMHLHRTQPNTLSATLGEVTRFMAECEMGFTRVP